MNRSIIKSDASKLVDVCRGNVIGRSRQPRCVIHDRLFASRQAGVRSRNEPIDNGGTIRWKQPPQTCSVVFTSIVALVDSADRHRGHLAFHFGERRGLHHRLHVEPAMDCERSGVDRMELQDVVDAPVRVRISPVQISQLPLGPVGRDGINVGHGNIITDRSHRGAGRISRSGLVRAVGSVPSNADSIVRITMNRRRLANPLVWCLGTALVSLGAGCSNPKAPKDINARFRDPNMKVAEWIERFEGESREVFTCRHHIMAALEIEPGSAVADVGAGTGLFIPLLANQTTAEGRVVAIEISPKFVEYIQQRAADLNIEHVDSRLCTERSIGLPVGSVDLVFTSDTYHHFTYPAETLASIFSALRPGGQLYVLDFERIEGVSAAWLLKHVRADKETVLSEIEAAGFEFIAEITPDCLEENYLLRFKRP